ncbi:MAG: TonB-dependent receptor [Candidatus Cloacimonetes bacterium]|nr:TonB-dependent receptor [Candidatus Cloacimonadota bacterium]
MNLIPTGLPRQVLLLAAILAATIPGWAARIQGHVRSADGQPLSGVNLVLVSRSMGAASALDGSYLISGIPAGRFILEVSCLGYTSRRLPLALDEDESLDLDLQLEPAAVELDALVVTGRTADGLQSSRTARVEVVEQQELTRASTDGGLLSSLASRTGVDTRPCALCGAAGVGLQGLDPSYTEIRVDGLSLYGGLGGIYGLDGIGVAGLQQVELSKGVSSAGAGSGAMAGSLNLVSAQTQTRSTLSIGIQGGDTQRHLFESSLVRPVGRASAQVDAAYYAEPDLLDRNNDGLSDTPSIGRGRLAFRLSRDESGWGARAAVQALAERRVAGDTRWTRADRGSELIYGREILTRRFETTLSGKRVTSAGDIRLDAGLAVHRQDSWYGPTNYDALQRRLNLRAGWLRTWSPAQSTELALEYLQDDYQDNLELASPTDRLVRVPSMLLHHVWTPGPQVGLESSLRTEKHIGGELVGIPRLALRWEPVRDWQVRLAAGSGYRPVTLFSLDKAAHAGFDGIDVPSRLRPERSRNLSAGLRWSTGDLESRLTLDGTLFRTDFSDKVVLSWDEVLGITRYANADDAFSQGLELRAELLLVGRWRLDAGGTWSRVRYRYTEPAHAGDMALNQWHDEHLNPFWTARAQLKRLWAEQAVEASLTLRSTGPQVLPEGRGKTYTPTYHLLDLDLQKSLANWTFGLRVENLTDWVQPDAPLVTTATGQTVDAALIYGPMLGRTILARVQWTYQKGSDS